jgi:hypothetical protein
VESGCQQILMPGYTNVERPEDDLESHRGTAAIRQVDATPGS